MEEAKPDPRLRPVWDAILEVYKVFAAICDKNGLLYCADCGTALGAVRHGGFIPWDDDMDIQMPRLDYEKFASLAQQELPMGYAWIDRFNCRDYDNGFGKVIITDKEKVDSIAEASGLRLGSGIFIDVFPMDGYPDSRIARLWRKIQNNLVGFSFKYSLGWKGCTTRRAKEAYIIGLLTRLFNYRINTYREQVEFYEQRAKRYPFGSTELCVSIGCAHYADDKPYPFRFFGKPKKIKFDSVEIPVQERVEDYLKAIFGDYMQLPPEEQRHGTHSEADFQPWRLGPVK